MAKAKYSYNSKRKEWSTRAWDGTYNADGSKHRVTISSRQSSADLERRVNEFRRQVENQGVVVYSDLTFPEYALHWLETSKSAREKNTQAMYRNIIRVHLSFLSDIRISDVRHSHFQQAINRQLEHPRTCKQIYITFRQIIKMAIRDRLLPRTAFEDICDDISLPAYHAPEKRPLTPEEKDAFRNLSMEPRKMAFVYLLYFCGLRREEALGLTRFDFDFRNFTVSVSRVVIYDRGVPEIKDYPKSHHGLRRIPVPDAGQTVIQSYVESCADEFLFHSRDSRLMTPGGYKRMWESIVLGMNRALGYNPFLKGEQKLKQGPPPISGLTAHIFRHNYCTELCYQIPKISVKMVARLMGDTERVVLDVYNHLVEEKENVAEAINDALAI